MAQTDQDSVYHAPRAPDWLWLERLRARRAGLRRLGLGATRHGQRGRTRRLLRRGAAGAPLGRADLHLQALGERRGWPGRDGPDARPLWRTQLPWAEVGRLVERSNVSNGQRYRWLVALARDGRELRIREDMVSYYERFRVEVYERYRLWEDHGGTWGTTCWRPVHRPPTTSSNLIVWWLIGAAATLLPGLYFALLIPDGLILGPDADLLRAALPAYGRDSAWLSRQTYTVDGSGGLRPAVPMGATALPWTDVMRVERLRSPARLLYRIGILFGHLLLLVAARADGRVESFEWAPQVPELLRRPRESGRQVRVNLHRLARPGSSCSRGSSSTSRSRARPCAHRPPPRRTSLPPEAQPADLTGASGPLDPWGAGTRAATSRRGGGQPQQSAQQQSPQPGPRVTKKFSRAGVADEIDPRIRAVLQDQTPSQPPASL